MARGYKDYTGGFGYSEVTIRPSLLFDTGKSIVTDDFESPMQKWLFSGSAGGSAALEADNAFTGSSCVKVTTDNDAGDYGGIYKYITLPQTQRVGFECTATLILNHTQYIRIEMWCYTGTVYYLFQVRHDKANNKWQYYNSAGDWTDVTGGTQSLLHIIQNYNRFKLVVDISTGKYVYLYCNEKVFDLRAHAAPATVNATSPIFMSSFFEYVDSAAAGVFYIDNVSVTEEP